MIYFKKNNKRISIKKAAKIRESIAKVGISYVRSYDKFYWANNNYCDLFLETMISPIKSTARATVSFNSCTSQNDHELSPSNSSRLTHVPIKQQNIFLEMRQPLQDKLSLHHGRVATAPSSQQSFKFRQEILEVIKRKCEFSRFL